MKGLLVEGVSEAVPQVPRGSEQFVSSETNYSAPAGWGEVEGLGLGENVEREKKSRRGDAGCLLGVVHQHLGRKECVVK